MSAAAFADTKPHYHLLDGLRGVAALIVLWYHLFEGFATSPATQQINHGYLAVDFFFMLSGFVMGYAYDDRWADRGNKGKMSLLGFFRRRLIRLHPMVVLGCILGAISFCAQGMVKWDGSSVSFAAVLGALAVGCLMLPAFPGGRLEVRGNGEMFPLNGPSWSLFFEYLANIVYALFLRKLSTRWLTAFVAVCGIGLLSFAVGNGSGYGHMGVGWTLEGWNFPGGLLRVFFAFPAGLLLSRLSFKIKTKHTFTLCTLTLIIFLAMPHLGENRLWLNGLYDALCILIVFPIVVLCAASAENSDKNRFTRWLGDLSYPLYAIHYPSMYLFYAWVWKHEYSFGQVWHVAVLLFLGNIALAWLFLKYYDEPVRKYLSRHSH